MNATRPGDTIANAAITRLSTRGTAYFSDRGTDVIVDVTGYFTGSPVAATLPVPPLDNGASRVLLVGDSTLLAVGSYGLLHAFQGFDDVYEAASCRTLGVPSCGRNPVPNSVATINAAVGRFDAVVIMAGYDEWWTTFPDSFEAVNAAARAKGRAPHHLAELSRGRRVQDARRIDRQRGVREEQPDPAREGRVRRQPRRRPRRLVRLHLGDAHVARIRTGSTSRSRAPTASPTTSRARSPTSRAGRAHSRGSTVGRSMHRAPTPTPTARRRTSCRCTGDARPWLTR